MTGTRSPRSTGRCQAHRITGGRAQPRRGHRRAGWPGRGSCPPRHPHPRQLPLLPLDPGRVPPSRRANEATPGRRMPAPSISPRPTTSISSSRADSRTWPDPIELEQPEVADLGQQPVQGGLIGDRAGDDGVLHVRADLEAFDPGGPPPVEDALEPDLIARVQAHVPSFGSGPWTCTLRTGDGIGVTRRWPMRVESFRDGAGTMAPPGSGPRSSGRAAHDYDGFGQRRMIAGGADRAGYR